MTTIKANYSSRCPSCGQTIRAGSSIAKGPGGKYVHVSCASGVQAPAAKSARARKPSAPRTRRSALPEGPMMRNDKAPYERGEVLTCQLTTAEIAECEARQSPLATQAKYNPTARAWLLPDGRDAIAVCGSCLSCGMRPAVTSGGHCSGCQPEQLFSATEIPGEPCKRAGNRRVAVVVIHTDRMSQDDADDNGYCGRYGCVVRLATAAEAAPLVAERATKAQAKADAVAKAQAWSVQLAELTAGRVLVEGGDIVREGAEVIHEERKGLHGTVSGRWSRLADGSIAQETYRYDDERWGRWVTTEQLLDLARASTRSLEDAIRGQRYSALDRAIVWLAAQAGQTPRPPVTVTLRGLEQPVTLVVRLSRPSGLIVAESLGGGAVRIPEGDSVRVTSEWAWPVDRLRAQLDAAPDPAVFADLEMAPGAEISSGDRLPLPGGLWIEGMRAALVELEARP